MQDNAAVPCTLCKAEDGFSVYKAISSLTVPASYMEHYSNHTIVRIVVGL